MNKVAELSVAFTTICETIEEWIEYNLNGQYLLDNGTWRKVNTPYRMKRYFDLDYVAIELSNVQTDYFFIKIYYLDEKLNYTLELCNFDNWKKEVTDYINGMIEEYSY